jgi:cob(I)alamin adenosyltransferase
MHFSFAPSGVIVACMLNAPGSWHDSYNAENGGLNATLQNVYETTGVVDSAFWKKLCLFLIKSGKKKAGESHLARTICRQATSL